MNRLKTFLAALAVAAIPATASAYNIVLTPGSLSSRLDEARGATSLVISGSCDARDLSLLRSLPADVTALDLSELEIMGFSDVAPTYFHRTRFSPGEIPPYCFFAAPYSEVKLPASAKSLGAGAFAGSAIASADIPADVTSLADDSFYGCRSLETVTLPAALTSLGKRAFANCSSLKRIDLSHTAVTEIPEECFAGCTALTELILPAGVKKIGREAFRHTGIVALSLGDVELAPYSLSGMPLLQSVRLGEASVLAPGVFMDNPSLTDISGVTGDIPELFAANSLNLSPSEVLSGADSVGKYAFAGAACDRMILGRYITAISSGAFHGMTGLTSIDASLLGDALPAVEADSFSGVVPSAIRLTVAAGSVDVWKNHPVWGEFNIVADGETAADAVADAEGISFSFRSGKLTVTASEPLKGVEVYDAGGRLLFSSAPGVPVAEIDLDAEADGVLIVKASAGSASRSVKIMK